MFNKPIFSSIKNKKLREHFRNVTELIIYKPRLPKRLKQNSIIHCIQNHDMNPNTNKAHPHKPNFIYFMVVN